MRLHWVDMRLAEQTNACLVWGGRYPIVRLEGLDRYSELSLNLIRPHPPLECED